MTFLSSFAAEFSGKFKEVIDLSENFKAWLKPSNIFDFSVIFFILDYILCIYVT
jgi:hypothetical protein